jgi:hypothetical protein
MLLNNYKFYLFKILPKIMGILINTGHKKGNNGVFMIVYTLSKLRTLQPFSFNITG